MSELTMAQLRERVRGEIITSEDPGYDEAARKVYNGMIDRRPSVIVRAVDVGDVMAGIDYARENGLDLSVRGGSHSVPGFGTCDVGVVIDLGRMNGVRVDPRRRTARAEGGCTWGDFNHATYAFGLATTGGIIASTGIAGLTLGGGIGYLSRGFGLSLDNLLSADVVTADGRFVVASAKENEDLFWALRGGGGNFGVVTSFEFQTAPSQGCRRGPLFYPIDRRATCSASTATTWRQRPEQMGLFPAFQIAPPLPFIPEKEHGKTFCASWPAGPARLTRTASIRWRRSERPRRPWPRSLHRCPTTRSTACSTPYTGRAAALLEGLFRDRASGRRDCGTPKFGPKVPVVNSTCTSIRSTAPATVFAWMRRLSPTATPSSRP